MKLMGQHPHAFARLHRLAIAAAVAVFAAMLAAALGTGSADAAPKVVVLGAAAPATPSCPTNCQAIGKTTGFQVGITGGRNPFTARFRRTSCGWCIQTRA